MSEVILDTRRRALEDVFFIEQEARLKRQLEQERTRQAERETIANATGITEPAVIDQLIELDLSATTLTALSLVPLVVVAWADGNVTEREHLAVLSAAEAFGFKPESTSYDLIDEWLVQRPPTALLSAWEACTAVVISKLDYAGRAALRQKVMSRARAVAETQGGFLTFGSISPAEQAMLRQLETILS